MENKTAPAIVQSRHQIFTQYIKGNIYYIVAFLHFFI